jgi:hypothetical protein
MVLLTEPYVNTLGQIKLFNRNGYRRLDGYLKNRAISRIYMETKGKLLKRLAHATPVQKTGEF